MLGSSFLHGGSEDCSRVLKHFNNQAMSPAQKTLIVKENGLSRNKASASEWFSCGVRVSQSFVNCCLTPICQIMRH